MFLELGYELWQPCLYVALALRVEDEESPTQLVANGLGVDYVHRHHKVLSGYRKIEMRGWANRRRNVACALALKSIRSFCESGSQWAKKASTKALGLPAVGYDVAKRGVNCSRLISPFGLCFRNLRRYLRRRSTFNTPRARVISTSLL